MPVKDKLIKLAYNQAALAKSQRRLSQYFAFQIKQNK